jgi:hypothetical protein
MLGLSWEFSVPFSGLAMSDQDHTHLRPIGPVQRGIRFYYIGIYFDNVTLDIRFAHGLP